MTPKKADEWRPVFIQALRTNANVRESCAAAGVTRKTAYQHRKTSQEFAAQWDEALEDACDELETEARRRAMDSSDTLMIFLLKAHRPDKYRETIRNEQSGTLRIQHAHELSDDDLAAIAAGAGIRSGSGARVTTPAASQEQPS